MPDAGLVKMQTYQWGTMPEMFGPRHEHRIGLMLRETALLPSGTRLLEAAVGLGQLAERLRQQGHRVFGIDSSIDAARHVRRTTTIPVVLGSLTALPFRSGAFGAVTSGETLEHIPDDAAAAREIGRVLSDRGTCVATVPALESLRTFSDAYYEHLRRYSPAGISALFERAGFDIVRTRFWGFPVVLAYDTFFILPMNRRRAKRPAQQDQALQSIARAGRARWLVRLVRAAFATDAWFRWIPVGVGLLLVARKKSG